MVKNYLRVFCVLLVAVLGSRRLSAQNVGLFESYGAKGMMSALKKAGMKTALIKKLDADTLFKYDVVILGSVKGVPADDRFNLVVYVRSGGGLLLHHDATGWRGWDDSLFPDLFKGYNREINRNVVIVDKKDPLTANLAAFKHAYRDHIILKAGADGKVVIKDALGHPLAVKGKVGKGRVVGNGMLTGYESRKVAAQIKDVPAAPSGEEERLLVNTVKWLAAPPITAQSPTKLKQLRRKVAGALRVEIAARVDTGAANGASDDAACGKGWFTPEMLTEQAFVHPPVVSLGGRFFLFDGGIMGVTNRGGRGRSYGEIVSILRQLKWMGITDFIAQTGGPFNLRYRSKVPDTNVKPFANCFKFDYLEVLERACRKTGMNLWVMWHSCVSKKALPAKLRKYCVRNAKGEIYAKLLDVQSPDANKIARKIIDEIAERYNRHGTIKGIFLDEPWHSFCVDSCEDNVAEFADYCEREYKESPPKDIAAKFAQGPQWHDPSDKWWRRYLLWRDSLLVRYTNRLTSYANKKGLKTMSAIVFPINYRTGWFWGSGDPTGLLSASNYAAPYFSEDSAGVFQTPNTLFGTHHYYNSGYSMASLIRGGGGFIFAFNGVWQPICKSVNSKAPEVAKRIARGCREWQGGKTLCDIGVLWSLQGLYLRFIDADTIYKYRIADLRRILVRSYDVSALLTDQVDRFKRFKVLVAPKYSLEYLTKKQYGALSDYVREGGNVVVLNSGVSVSTKDHLRERKLFKEFTGLERKGRFKTAETFEFDGETFKFDAFVAGKIKSVAGGTKVLSVLKSRKTPLITSRRLGAGSIVFVNFNIADLLHEKEGGPMAARLLKRIVEKVASPAVSIEGDLKIMSSLRKGNWVVVSMLDKDCGPSGSDARFPVTGKLRVDVAKLGLPPGEYQVFSLARDREIAPSGKAWEMHGRNLWTAEMLKDGIDVFIPKNSLAGLKLQPEKMNDSQRLLWKKINNDKYISKYVLRKWDNHTWQRDYEHEIIAICPSGEAFPLRK